MNMKYNILSILFLLIILSNTTTLFGQGVGINDDNSTPNTSAMLDIKSTNKGVLVPRMTSTQRTAIATPATGLLVFDNTTTSFWFYDGAAWIELGNSNSNLFTKTGITVLPNTTIINEATDDFVFGSTQLEDNGNTNHDNRFFFDKSKGAFRVGQVRGSDWDDVNRGLYSFASGQETEASGDYSTAMGARCNALGDYSTALGYTGATYGDYSMIWGEACIAYNTSSTAWGSYTDAIGHYSTAGGRQTNAYSAYEVALGCYDSYYIANSVSGWDVNDRLLNVGNGTSSTNRSDAFTLYKSGNATLAGTLAQSSDKTLKTNINSLDNSLDNILQLNGYTYNWKATENRSEELQIGVIAQEVEALYPELVRKDGNGKLTVIYSGLIPVLIEATKEQQVTIKTQESRIIALEKELSALKNLVIQSIENNK